MHALRANCGSYLYDSLRHQWLSEQERRAMEEGERRAMEEQDSARRQQPQESAGGEEIREESGLPSQWPLFGSPTLTTIRVTSYRDKGGTIYFVVQPTLEGFRWIIEKTYDDFAHLHKSLVAYGISRALLPSKKLFGYFGSPKPQYLKEMQIKLDQLLKAVIQKYPVPPRPLLEFCNYPFCDVLSVTQTLAAYVFEKGDYVLSNKKAMFMSPLQLHCVGRRMTLPIASSGTGSLRDDFGNVLDFLMQLQKLKIAASTEDTFSLSPMEDITFDLSLLKSLTFLAIDCINVKDLQGRQELTTQLEGLDIRRCLTSLQEVLVVYPVDCVLSLPMTVDLNRALKWTRLNKICFKLNNITSIDESLKLLPCLESLDLSYNYIETIEHLTELPHLKVVDLSHNKVSSVCDLHLKIGNLSKLGLAHNQLTSLEGFDKCRSLLYLDLSSNQIAEVAEVGHLSGLPVLEELYLRGNPIKQSSSYRSSVFSLLPTTADKISLDAKKASHDELELSMSLAGVKRHRRVPSRTADIKPDRDESATQEAEGEYEVATSVTSRLEGMRKMGGDKWLSLLNTDKSRHTVVSHDTDDVVVHSSKGREKKRKHRKHPGQLLSSPTNESSTERDSPTPVISDTVEMEEEDLSQELHDMIHTLQSEKLHLADLPVTVMEYTGPLDSLSSRDVDQKLLNSRLEECSVCVDTSVMRLLETVLSTNKTRCQRDLALLEDIRFHEGKKKGVCLRFAQFSGSSLWVIYCVQDLGALARLYVAVQQGLKSVEASKSSIATGTSLPKVYVEEETDSSPVTVHTETEPESDLQNVHVGSNLATDVHVHVAAEPGIQACHSNPLHRSSELLPATPSGVPKNGDGGRVCISAPVTPPRSHSPSPKPESSPTHQEKGFSTLKTTVKSMAGGDVKAEEYYGTASVREKRGTASMGGSVEHSPTGSTKAIHAAAVEVKGQTRRSVSPTPKTKMGHTEPTEVAVTSAVSEGAKVSQPSSESSISQLSITLASGKDSKPTKLTTGSRKIMKKPGVEQQSLVRFFNGKIACEQNEVLMNIIWGGASLTSTPGCEVEGGVFVSDKGLYLLQVMDTESDDSLSWHTENTPLICSFHAYHPTLSQVRMGIFDQSITFECVEKGTRKSLVMFPRTSDNMLVLLENLKAALDSSGISHSITSVQESILSSGGCSNVAFVNPDISDLQMLKESLVRPKVMAHLCSHIMGYYAEPSTTLLFAEEMKKASEDAAAKFEILQYVVVSEISSDLLPISNGIVHFRPKILVLTNSALYLCKDDAASWPMDPDSPVCPPFSRCSVLDSYPIESITSVEMCDKAQAIALISDPVYEFRITFECAKDVRSTSGSHSWQLCVYDRQYIDQFFSSLNQLLWSDSQHSSLTITHTAESLTAVSPNTPPSNKVKQNRQMSPKSDITSYDPVFYESKALVHLASLTSSERLKFFREHVSEAQFMKSDEVPLAIFLSICSTTSQREFTQIEACVMASQYAVYLVSDVENIRKWLDGGGPSTFSRMSLLNKQGADTARCFFRLWINEIKELEVGFFYLSMQLKASKSEHNFAIHSQDASSVLALLSALSCSANLRNTVEEEEYDELLSGYVDLGGDSLSTKAKQAQKNVKTHVEFREQSTDSLETLKQILLCISPSITRSSTIEQSTSALQIILSQVMIMIEETSIHGTRTIQYQPQLVLLSNYGLFVCANSTGDNLTPAVLQPADLKVKKWCHIDLIDHVEVVSNPRLQQCKGRVFSINLQSQKGTDGQMRTLVLAAENSEELSHFVYYLSLLWYERSEKHLPVYRI